MGKRSVNVLRGMSTRFNAEGMGLTTGTITTGSTLTSGYDFDVSKANVVIVNTGPVAEGGGNANNVIQGFTGGISGQVLYLCKTGSSNTLTLEDHEGVSGVQNICLPNAADFAFAAGSGGAVLVCDGTNWNVISITGSEGSTNP